MAPKESPLRCLAISVMYDATGEIDRLELERFLNDVAGQGQWITADQWLFIDPPAEIGGEVTLPVVMPTDAAVKAVLNDLTNVAPRIASTVSRPRLWPV